MSKQDLKLPYNAPGKFYVTSECIDCDICRSLAPDHFQLNEEDSLSYVFSQPKTKDEIEVCEEARESCPAEAIENDGE